MQGKAHYRMNILSLGVLLLGLTQNAAAQSLAALAQGLNLEPTITTSGISSGAYMAQQLHVSYSSRIKGVGIIAGGPYRCAAGEYPKAARDWTRTYVPLSVCTHMNLVLPFAGPPQLQFSLTETARMAKSGLIDNPKNLAQSKVWLFSGAKDPFEPRSVMDVTYNYYRQFVPDSRITYIKHAKAGHGMITASEGNQCELSASPYISRCGFDAAGELLNALVGVSQPKAAQTPNANLHTFDQTPFFDLGHSSTSLDTQAHVYIPSSCAKGEVCQLHIALHGCGQTQALIGDRFFKRAGYNEWAETNHLVVLYPQTKVWITSLWMGTRSNPTGCWDWWGYSSDDYGTKQGVQEQAIAGMVNTLMGRAVLK